MSGATYGILFIDRFHRSGRLSAARLLAAGVPMAVITRRKSCSPPSSIETVMSHWEARKVGRSPARSCSKATCASRSLASTPSPGTGRGTVRRSSTVRPAWPFVPTIGEPGANVNGLEHLQPFAARRASASLHISTATSAACAGRILGPSLTRGQQMGNVYGQQDQGRKAARGRLRLMTVYRPTSIVGDSQTGYSTNYHGFYLPTGWPTRSATASAKQMNERFWPCSGSAAGREKPYPGRCRLAAIASSCTGTWANLSPHVAPATTVS